MADEDFIPSPSAAGKSVTVGEDLSTHSEKDLEERIAALESEIERTRTILAQRENIRSAADAVFKL